jgi:hypothetical protein
MTKQASCIFCNGPAGSGEHVFPACLGGRRVDKGILCGPCNNSFSKLDGEICKQLGGINAIMGVVRDRDSEPRPVEARGDDGISRQVQVTDLLRVRMPPREVTTTNVDGKKETIVYSTSKRALQGWIHEQRKSGRNVKATREVSDGPYFVPTLIMETSIGGADFFRAVARIALNFLAKHCPDLARRPELSEVKDYIKGSGGENFVGYMDQLPGCLAPDDKYKFGHRIVVFSNACHGHVGAYVSLFEVYEFQVTFSRSCAVDSSVSLVSFVSPLLGMHASRL